MIKCVVILAKFGWSSDKDHFFRKCNGKFFFNSLNNGETIERDRQLQNLKMEVFKEFYLVVEEYINKITKRYAYYVNNEDEFDIMMFNFQEGLKYVIRDKVDSESHRIVDNILSSLIEQVKSKKNHELLEAKLELVKEFKFHHENQSNNLNKNLLMQLFRIFKHKFDKSETNFMEFIDNPIYHEFYSSDICLEIIKDNNWIGYFIVLHVIRQKMKDENHEVDLETLTKIYNDLKSNKKN